MKRILGLRPSPALVIALIALFVALGGVSYGLAGSNTVFKDDIVRGAVGKSEARVDSIGRSEAREDGDPGGGFTGAQVNEGTLGTVPRAGNANLLDNLDSSAFLKGRTASGGTVVANNASSGRIITVPRGANLDVTDCDDDEVGNDGALVRLSNTSGGPLITAMGEYASNDLYFEAIPAGGSSIFTVDDLQVGASDNRIQLTQFFIGGSGLQGEINLGTDLSIPGCRFFAGAIVARG
jgi:hypothetical protein